MTKYGKYIFHSLLLIKRELSVNRKDLRALTLVGPTRNNRILDPLAVLHLDNRLYIMNSNLKKSFIKNMPVDG